MTALLLMDLQPPLRASSQTWFIGTQLSVFYLQFTVHTKKQTKKWLKSDSFSLQAKVVASGAAP